MNLDRCSFGDAATFLEVIISSLTVYKWTDVKVEYRRFSFVGVFPIVPQVAEKISKALPYAMNLSHRIASQSHDGNNARSGESRHKPMRLQ